MHDDLEDLDVDLSVVEGHDANLSFSDDHSVMVLPSMILAFSSILLMLDDALLLLLLLMLMFLSDAVMYVVAWYVKCDG